MAIVSVGGRTLTVPDATSAKAVTAPVTSNSVTVGGRVINLSTQTPFSTAKEMLENTKPNNDIVPNTPPTPPTPPRSTGGGGGSTSAKKIAIDYWNADIAKKYGMAAETAYQEALSNTAYQRAVKDLKAAGLNPVLAMGKVQGADSFAAEPVTQQGGGGGGGGSRRKQEEKSGVDWSKVSKIVSTVATVANTAIKIAGAL